MTRDEETLRLLAEQILYLTDVRRTRSEREAYGAQLRQLAKDVLRKAAVK